MASAPKSTDSEISVSDMIAFVLVYGPQEKGPDGHKHGAGYLNRSHAGTSRSNLEALHGVITIQFPSSPESE